MNALMHTRLPFHAVAIFCIVACFFSFYWGYGKSEREIKRAHRKSMKEMEERLPKAIR